MKPSEQSPEFDAAFREWFETNVDDKDRALHEAIYRPLYLSFLAGASCAVRYVEQRTKTHSS